MPIDTLVLLILTLLTVAIVLIAILYTTTMHHVRTQVRPRHSGHQHWMIDVIWACVPWLIVLALIGPTLKKILMHS